MNVNDFIQAMSAGTPDDDDPGMTYDQMVTQLREHFEIRQEVERFEPGQIVHNKAPRSADVRNAHWPLVFVRYLDEPVRALDFCDLEDLATNSAPRAFDCVAGRLIRHGARLIYSEFFVDSRDLRLAEES